MKQVRYADIDVLIIDDQPEARSYTRDMLREFGSKHVDTVSNGDDALERIRESRFDLVLSDYNLGDGRDGQQVLEEVRHGGLLPQTAAYVMITADSSPYMVMGALEYHPDGYIMKPYTRSDLRKRLTRLLEAKSLLAPIEAPLSEQQYQEALTACDQVARRHPEQMVAALRHKGALLILLHRHGDAEKLYRTVLSKRMLPWAQLGLGKSLYHQGRLEESAAAFQVLIDENEAYVEARDWLARILAEQGHTEEAERELLAAVEVSGKAVRRQMELARIAEKNGSWEVSEKAYRKSVTLGRHSVYRNANNYFGLVTALEKNLEGLNSRERRKAGDEALRVLKEADRVFDDREVRCRAAAQRARACRLHGKNREAEVAEKRALDLLAKMEDPPRELKELVESNAEVKREAGERVAREKCESLNNQGVELFKNGRAAEAYTLFREAVASGQASYAVQLNALQALLTLVQKGHPPDGWIAQAEQLLAPLEAMPEDDSHRERFTKLNEMHKRLAAAT